MNGTMNPAPIPDATSVLRGAMNNAAQIFAGLKTFNDGVASPTLAGLATSSLGGSDIAVKIGTRVPAASIAAGGKLASIRDTLGGTEVEYVSFIPATAANFFRAVQLIDTKGQTHVGGLAILNNGAGDSGIWYEGSPAQGGVGIGLGSVSTRGLFTSSTNRSQSWYQNQDAYSTGSRALYDWESADSVAMRAKDFARYTLDAAHTGNALAIYLGATLKVGITAAGNMFIPTGAALYLGGAVASGCYIYGSSLAQLELGVNNATHFTLTSAGVALKHSLQLNTDGNTQPTADASNRGKIWYSKSAAGVADTLEVCLKSAADTYSWKVIQTG